MDMRQFFKKIREVEDVIKIPEVILVSNQTDDGGKAGVKNEVKRSVAARMIAEGKARLATEDETKEFHQAAAEAFKLGQDAVNSGKVQLAVLTDSEMKAIKSALKSK